MDKVITMFSAVILAVSMVALPAHAAKPVCTDGDGDTYSPVGKSCGPVDCDDGDPTVWSLNSCGDCAPEPPGGCGGTTCTDNDGDGYGSPGDPSCPAGSAQDCDDTNPAVNPGAPEICSDGIDNDCDGATDGADSDCTPTSSRDVIVMASNDLGMHCACPGADYMLLLPPFNTLRAQVIERGGSSPVVLSDPADIRVEYDVVENYDEFNPYKADDPSKVDLRADPYYATWMGMMPKYGFGDAENPDGSIRGLAGKGLAGEMDAEPEGWWEAVGVPAFPDVLNSSPAEKIMVDPLGGGNRNPYLTAEVKVYEQSSGALLASTDITVPVSFGGCCTCHLQLAEDTPGYSPDPESSFHLMGALHARQPDDPNGTGGGFDFADPTVLDPDGDGAPGPVRCSVCHWDPAMGESAAPGGYVNATTGAPLPTSQYSFSDVLHRWHVENDNVLAYDPDLATDCYQCHPSNEVNCYRGHHTNKLLGRGADEHAVWCTDCHGDLNQRVAEGQLANPWSPDTLPTCQKCHSSTGENNVLAAFGGSFLKSMSHKNDKILCSTCHGSPHALNPSTLAKDNQQNIALQEQYVGTAQGAYAIGVCQVCHYNKKASYSKPAH